MILRTSSGTRTKRGCGSAQKGGSYLCCATSPAGIPIEHFLIDPVRPMPRLEPFRAPILVPDPNDPGLFHAMIWIGAKFYPSAADYIEETRRMGASRRIPNGFPTGRLTPGRSRMLLVHPKAGTDRDPEPAAHCPALEAGRLPHREKEPCLGAQYHYALALGSQPANNDGPETRHAKIGDISYPLPADQWPAPDAFPAIFMQLPITHVEYHARHLGDQGHDGLEKADHAGWTIKIIEHPEQPTA